jgi:hypothetical protein
MESMKPEEYVQGELGSSNFLLSCKLTHFAGLHIWVF